MRLKPLTRRLRIVIAASAGFMAGPAGVAAAQDAPPLVAPRCATAEELLGALETADADLRALAADVDYWKFFDFGDPQRRLGRLYFTAEPRGDGGAAERKFAVRFERMYVGRERHDERVTLVFDGRWLVEKRHDARPREFIAREVARPGQVLDPMSVKGPFPIPIGQKRAEILERFEASLAPAADGLGAPEGADDRERELAAANVAFVEGRTQQIILRPRGGANGEEPFEEIRLWYARSGERLLPRMVRTVDDKGDVAIVKLINVEVNDSSAIDADAMDTAEPPRDAGWNVRRERLEAP